MMQIKDGRSASPWILHSAYDTQPPTNSVRMCNKNEDGYKRIKPLLLNLLNCSISTPHDSHPIVHINVNYMALNMQPF